MATQPSESTASRLQPQPHEVIDRTRTISFTFNGRSYTAHPGDTIASALAAAGVKVFSRSFKYHRPRGLMCCAGHCPNCLVQVGDEPSVRSCVTLVEQGMVVEPQNAWPSLDYDVMSLTALGDQFLPVGFYYKTFIRPQALWPAYEHFLRHAAGLGEVHPDTPPGEYNKQYLHADVVVVGGGPAGMAAAVAAAESGARVLLFDENSQLGGHGRYVEIGDWRSEMDNLQSLISNLPALTVQTNTTLLGYYEDNWLSAVSGNMFYKIRAKAVVFATGVYEQPLVFDNNDLPGVVLGSGVQRMLRLYGVAMGQTAVLVTNNDAGWQVAADLQQAGITVAAIAEQRPKFESDLVAKLVGTTVHWGHTIQEAKGRGKVESAVLAPVDAKGQVSQSGHKKAACDLLVVSMGFTPANGLLYQAGVDISYNKSQNQFLPNSFPPGIFAAGQVTGVQGIGVEVENGRFAGQQAAQYAGFEFRVSGFEFRVGGEVVNLQSPISNPVQIPGHKKQFICFCEDVTEKDLQTAIAEGFDSMELLKRYSTISMGPCQGKMCSANTVHLCARANNWTIEETGSTTARPPMKPLSLGNLAGLNMEPVQVTPIHNWHLAQGAKMMLAGLWLRPEHYGDITAEIQAVRQSVGLIDVSTLGKLRFTGPGVPALLERIYTNQWKNLGVGRVRYGVMCNDEGIILDDGVTARVGEQEWYTTTTTSGAGAMFEWIQWWMQSGWGEGVHLNNLTEVNAAFNLAGPNARDVLRQLTEADISNAAFPYMHLRDLFIAGVPCRVMRLGFTGELSYEVHCPSGYALHVWQALMEAGRGLGIRPFGVEAQRVLRLEKAHIIVSQDTDALTDPFAADMAWAVKLDKPDFLGKRTYMRISAEQPKQRLVGFKTADPGLVPEEGLQIVKRGSNNKWEIIGWVTSCKFSPTLNETIGLCWLPAELAAVNGAAFVIRLENGRAFADARVFHGPFYDPAGERLRS